ncbi:MAG: ATP-binding protein [Halococcoides sp.]
MTAGTGRATVLVEGSFGDPITPPGAVLERVADVEVRTVADATPIGAAVSDGVDGVVLAAAPIDGERVETIRDRAPDRPIVMVGEASAMPADSVSDPMVRVVRDDGTDRTARIVASQLLDCGLSEPRATVDIAALSMPAFVYDAGFRAINDAFADCVGRSAATLRDAPLSTVFDREASDLVRGAADDGPLSVTLSAEASTATRSLWVERDGERFVGVLGPRGADDGDDAASILDSLLEGMPLSIYVKDRRGRHVAVSRSLVGGMADDRSTIDAPDGTIHHVPADVIGKTDFDLYPDANAEQFRETDERVIEHGEPVVDRENVRLTADEQRFAVTDLKVPWYRDDEIAGVIGIAIDDTDSWRAKRRAEIRAGVLETIETVLRTALAPRLGGEPDDHDAIQAAVADLQTLLGTRQLPDAAAATDLADRARSVWTSVVVPDAATVPPSPDRDGPTLELTDTGVIDAHPDLLETLLAELFDNALDYAGPDPTVRIGTIDEGFFVADDGPGIPPERRSEVLTYGTSERDDRLGSGLAVAAAIARAHGWELTISDGRDGGTRVTVTGVRSY